MKPRSTGVIVTGILLFGAAVAQAAETLRPIYSLETDPPSKERIEAFLAGGVAWTSAGGRSFRIEASGRVSVSHIDFGGRPNGSLQCSCTRQGSYQVTKSAITITCPYRCEETYQHIAGADRPPLLLYEKPTDFRLRVLYASPDALIFRDETLMLPTTITKHTTTGERWLVTQCLATTETAIRRRCEADGTGGFDYSNTPVSLARTPFYLQFIRGTEDAQAHAALKRILQTSPAQALGLATLIEGPPGRHPRLQTEVYFAKGTEPGSEKASKAHADAVAALLSKSIGPVEVKQWPGGFDYEVVVVSGPPADNRTNPAPLH